MSHKNDTMRRQERRKNRMSTVARRMIGNLVYVLLAGAVFLFALVVVLAARHGTSAPNPPLTSSAAATSAIATADAGAGWIALKSNSPQEIINAARKSTLFTENRSGDGDYLKDLSRLETPVLVLAMHVPGSIVMPDYYVIPIDDSTGAIVAAAELALNPQHTAIQVSAIITYSAPRPHGQMAHVNQAAAVSASSTQHHIALRSGAQPQLVYIPIDASLLETGKVTWTGGGLYPADPAWLIPGANGPDQVIGTDGHAYAATAVPVMKQP